MQDEAIFDLRYSPPSPPGPLSLRERGRTDLPDRGFSLRQGQAGRNDAATEVTNLRVNCCCKTPFNLMHLKSLSLREGLPRLSGKGFRVRARPKFQKGNPRLPAGGVWLQAGRHPPTPSPSGRGTFLICGRRSNFEALIGGLTPPLPPGEGVGG